MKIVLKKAFAVLLGLLIIPLLAVLHLLFYKIFKSSIGFDTTYPIYILASTIFISLIIVIRFRKQRFFSTTLLSLLIISVGVIVYNKTVRSNKSNIHKSEWNCKTSEFEIPFYTGKQGHIYLEANINGVKGLLLYDTGADVSMLVDSVLSVNSKKNSFFTMKIRDSNGVRKKCNLYSIGKFELGAISISNLKVTAINNLEFINDNGLKIIGIIGNNIIRNYTWDFNLKENKLTVSNSNQYDKTLPDSTAVNLIRGDKNWKVPVVINGIKKQLKLDFGSYSCISIKDSIPQKDKFRFEGLSASRTQSGIFSTTDSLQHSATASIVSLEVGNFFLKRVLCGEKAKSDLLGIPLIWNYERVVFVPNNDKIYFITEVEDNVYGYRSKLGKYFLRNLGFSLKTSGGNCKLYARNPFSFPAKMLNEKKDTLDANYEAYGTMVFYATMEANLQNHFVIDSIESLDSVLLPDKKMKIGKYVINQNIVYQSIEN